MAKNVSGLITKCVLSNRVGVWFYLKVRHAKASRITINTWTTYIFTNIYCANKSHYVYMNFEKISNAFIAKCTWTRNINVINIFIIFFNKHMYIFMQRERSHEINSLFTLLAACHHPQTAHTHIKHIFGKTKQTFIAVALRHNSWAHDESLEKYVRMYVCGSPKI